MRALRQHRGLVAPLLRQDIDTDQIIPQQFLKSIERTGFGRHLFHGWRRRADGTPDPSFVLNDPRYAGASILVAGANFGCGSSREHAAWALDDYGFVAVVAPSFADIFRSNAIKNGVLPVVLPEAVVATIGEKAATTVYILELDVERRRARDADGLDLPFELEDAAWRRLLHGLDDIDLILQHEDAIARYERQRPVRVPTPNAAARAVRHA